MKKEKISGLTAVYRKVREGYVAYVEEIPGVNTQGRTLKSTKANLADALRLALTTNRELAEKETHGRPAIKEKLSIEL